MHYSMLNGQVQCDLEVTNRGLAYGDGVFTTMAWRGQKIEFLASHMQRLNSDASRLYFTFDERRLNAELDQFVDYLNVKGVVQGIIKIILFRDAEHRGYRAEKNTHASRLLIWQALPKGVNDKKKQGVHLRVCDYRLSSHGLAGVKHLNRIDQVLARIEWQDAIDDVPVFDGLMCNQNDQVIETTSANIFWVQGSTVYTPSLSNQGVNGVMREQIMHALQAHERYDFCEGEFMLDSLLTADEVFISNSLMHVVPVISLVGFETDWSLGRVSRVLNDILQQALVMSCKP